jgi:hypothetical protein
MWEIGWGKYTGRRVVNHRLSILCNALNTLIPVSNDVDMSAKETGLYPEGSEKSMNSIC